VTAIEDTIIDWLGTEETLQEGERNIPTMRRVLPRMEEMMDQKEPVQN
jgi:hypothetical protein